MMNDSRGPGQPASREGLCPGCANVQVITNDRGSTFYLCRLSIVDKRTLEVVRTITPAPGKTAAHVEFDKTGRYVLVSVWEMDGALVIYDASTFAEVKRIPMSRPSGKYNVWNKITFSEGTSH